MDPRERLLLMILTRLLGKPATPEEIERAHLEALEDLGRWESGEPSRNQE